MKTLCLLALLLVPGVAARAQLKPEKGLELPELHIIKPVTLSPCYSCRTQEEFSRGYERTALFLTEEMRRLNSPALLFNGFQRGPDYFQVSTAGADMSAIADLGEGIALSELTAQDFHHGIRRPGEAAATPMQFGVTAPVRVGHTYAVIINKGRYRGLLFFAVDGYQQNERVELRYVVKHYEALRVTGQSPGFDWSRKSTPQ